MTRPLVAFLAVVAMASAAFGAADRPLPAHLGYTVLFEGERVGHCDIRTERLKDGNLAMHAKLVYDGKALDLTLEGHTVVDPETWRPVSYRWNGKSNGGPFEGRIRVEGDRVTGRYRLNGSTWAEGTRQVEGALTLFEDYSVAHQILMARAFEHGGWHDTTMTVLRPSTFRFVRTTFSDRGERLIESSLREAVCRKVAIKMEGAAAYASYYDPESGLPVYLAFPAVATEFFLDSFHGEHPDTWFVRKSSNP